MAKAVTLKDKDGVELYPVTSMDLVVGASYRDAETPAGNITLPANTITTVQSMILPAGVWRICYMVRGFYTGNPLLVESYLYEGNTQVFDLAANAPTIGTDARWQIVASVKVAPSANTTYTTRVRCSVAGTISGGRCYMYAFRVG